MKRILLLFTILAFLINKVSAQKFPLYIAPSMQHALGEFNTTHSWAFGIEAGSARWWFDSSRIHKISFTFKAGYTYYTGRLITTSSFPDPYSDYSLVHALGGLQFNPTGKTVIRLFAGPGLGIYSGKTRFVLTSELDAAYLIKPKFAAGPTLTLLKESGADPTFSFGVKGILKI